MIKLINFKGMHFQKYTCTCTLCSYCAFICTFKFCSVCTCMYVYMYVCIHACMHACIYYVCIYVCVCIYVLPYLLPSPVGGGYSSLSVCVCVSVLPQNCCLNSIITKSKQVAVLKLGNLRQTVALYKIG